MRSPGSLPVVRSHSNHVDSEQNPILQVRLRPKVQSNRGQAMDYQICVSKESLPAVQEDLLF